MCNAGSPTCMGQNGGMVESWFDLQAMMPKNPLDIVSYVKLGTTEGILGSSIHFQQPSSGAWRDPLVTISGPPACYAVGTDDVQKVEDAKRWNFSHPTWYGDFDAAKCLRKLIFLRGGPDWKMIIPLNFTSAWTDVLFSFRNNAATRGDAQGTVPVVKLTNTFSGAFDLEVSLKSYGLVTMAMVGTQAGDTAMFEMEWVVVP